MVVVSALKWLYDSTRFKFSLTAGYLGNNLDDAN